MKFLLIWKLTGEKYANILKNILIKNYETNGIYYLN